MSTSDEYDSPRNLVPGEKITVKTKYGVQDVTYKETEISGCFLVAIEGYGDIMVQMDPLHCEWRRAGASAGKVQYGVRCTGKYCGEFFEHAEVVPNFLCYSCRNR